MGEVFAKQSSQSNRPPMEAAYINQEGQGSSTHEVCMILHSLQRILCSSLGSTISNTFHKTGQADHVLVLCSSSRVPVRMNKIDFVSKIASGLVTQSSFAVPMGPGCNMLLTA